MTVKEKTILKKVLKLHDLFQRKQIKTLARHEVHPDLALSERANYLYFTLPVSINFQRSSPAMWQAALKTWNDAQTRYLFFPEKLLKKKSSTIKKDLTKYRLALQTNKHPQIWMKISQTLNSHFSNDPRKILEVGDFDVRTILQIIQIEKKKDFPYLSGIKMANYWLYILSKYTDVKLKNMEAISIIPDTHIMQSSVKLGLVDENASRERVAQTWASLLNGSGIRPVDMHSVLWNWSRNNFFPEV